MLDLVPAEKIRAAALLSPVPMLVRVFVVARDGRVRQRLREILLGERNAVLAGETETAAGASSDLITCRPELLILDSALPQRERVELVASLDEREGPAVALLGTDPRRALDAIRMRAVDFLLLPLDPGQVREAVRRTREELAHRLPARRVGRNGLGGEASEERVEAYPSRIAVRSTKRLRFVRVGEIDWFEADGNRTRLHRGSEIDVLRESITACERLLDPRHFLRIHRSAIVSASRIEELEIDRHGDCTVVLGDGTRLRVARRHRGSLQRLLQQQ